MFELDGKRALITGAASGIGRSLCARLASAGARVVATDLEAPHDVAETIAATSGDATALELDVTDRSSVERARDRVEALGGLDVLVNNAGVVFGGAFGDVDWDRHRRTFDVDLVGVASVTHAFVPLLERRPEARIALIASAAGLVGLPYAATYAASKWGVVGFGESLRQELRLAGRRHVAVTTVCPSFVDTGLFEGARPVRLTRMLSTDRLAARIVRAIERGATMLRTPWPVAITPTVRGLLPVSWFDRVAHLLGATTSMRGWRGRSRP